MIHLITLNPAIDHFITADDFAFGKTNYVKDDYIVFGGKAINVAHVLKELDEKCRLVTTMDPIYQEFIKQNIQDLDYHLIMTKQVRINSKINISGVITELNSLGQSLQDKYAEFTTYVKENVQKDDIVLLAGNPHPEDYQFMLELGHLIKLQQGRLIIDCSKITFADLKQIQPELIKPNDEEIATLLEMTNPHDEEIIKGAEKIQQAGVKQVAVTLGKYGSLFLTNNNLYQVSPLTGEVVNTVGAGDSYVAGLIYGLSQNLEVETMLKYASACASASAFSQGLATKAGIEKYYQEINVKQI